MCYKLLQFLLLLAILGACTTTNTTAVEQNTTVFFDLEDYFEKEATRLNNKAYQLKKKLTIDGKEEEQVQAVVKFEEELRPFARLNINQPTWRDKYHPDSVFSATQQLEAIDYTTLDESMKITKLVIMYDSLSKVREIYIEKQSSSLIMNTQETFIYQADKGYSIHTFQDIKFFDDKEILLEVEYIR